MAEEKAPASKEAGYSNRDAQHVWIGPQRTELAAAGSSDPGV
jgi:hypothetical protein